MRKDNVSSAFDLLVEEIQRHIQLIQEEGAALMTGGQLAQAKRAINEAEDAKAFLTKVREIASQWKRLRSGKRRRQAKSTRKTEGGRAPRGSRTPEKAFRIPILAALVELGGSAKLGDVLDRVESAMRQTLKPCDFEPLPSDPNSVRWRNTAQWCRNTLVKEGLMKQNSPHGTWEISDKGRRYLASAKKT
ncbi:MAG: hypothetical protein KatS3mg015_0782 [Fimbriimonadales bacterium]|nr:MAG: hypothetical protein KatS3mg015_0782 [Fimbriimonadales bacterium]